MYNYLLIRSIIRSCSFFSFSLHSLILRSDTSFLDRCISRTLQDVLERIDLLCSITDKYHAKKIKKINCIARGECGCNPQARVTLESSGWDWPLPITITSASKQISDMNQKRWRRRKRHMPSAAKYCQTTSHVSCMQSVSKRSPRFPLIYCKHKCQQKPWNWLNDGMYRRVRYGWSFWE